MCAGTISKNIPLWPDKARSISSLELSGNNFVNPRMAMFVNNELETEREKAIAPVCAEANM
jgi:hypothetical protein